MLAKSSFSQRTSDNFVFTIAGATPLTLILGASSYASCFVKYIKAHTVENPDVTGAGDTVISVLSLAYTKTKDIELSAKIANATAAVVVGKTGTATVGSDELALRKAFWKQSGVL